MFVNKPPDSGKKTSRFPLHQDLFFFPIRPADRIVCAWTAMEHVHSENGCLVVLPGTHKSTLEQHAYPNWKDGINKMYYGIKNFDVNEERQHVEMWPGDTIFFHPLLIHGSGINKTSGFRKIFSCHYADSACQFIEYIDDASQELMSKEFGEVFRKKAGLNVPTYQDVFKHYIRLVHGKRINI